MQNLSGQVALVTGASSGIGKAIAEALATEGVRLALTGRDRDRLDETRARCREAGAEARCYTADLAVEAELNSIKIGVDHDFGALHILVHAAGVLHFGPCADLTGTQFQRLLAVNTIAPYTLTQLFLPRLKRHRGQVVFINSRAAFMVWPSMAQYCASKAALKAMADCLRLEVSGRGVRVMSVYPGKVATPMLGNLLESRNREYEPGAFPQPGEVAAVVISSLKLPHHVELSDVTIQPQSDPVA